MVTTISHSGDEAFAADTVPLKTQLRRVERINNIRAFVLVAPLLLFLLATFIVPIIALLTLSVRNPEIRSVMPETTVAIESWDGTGLPDERIVAIFVKELRASKENQTIGKVGKRLNYSISGFRSMVLQTGRKLPPPEVPPSRVLDELVRIDGRWGQTEYWITIQQAASPLTDFYLLRAFDLKRNVEGEIVKLPSNRAVYVNILMRTLGISGVVTVLCLILGYPVAYLLANLATRTSNLLMLFVLIPFYTALLVRTTAWLVLLQQHGIVNDTAIALGLYDERLPLVHNRFGVYVAMVHILLPFMLLPIYSVMKGISPEHMRAAKSLGADALLAFRQVYLPQTLPGVAAGSLLVFILSMGFYVTPALVGGPRDQFVSYFIAYYTNQTVNWGMAAALSVVLLSAVLILFFIYYRLVGVEKMKLG